MNYIAYFTALVAGLVSTGCIITGLALSKGCSPDKPQNKDEEKQKAEINSGK